MNAPNLAELELFVAQADPTAARVRALLPCAPHDAESLKLSGQIVGPRCDFSKTLPARIPLVARDSAEGLAAEAIVPDPCFWTPELPFLYDVQIEIVGEGKNAQTIERILGIPGLRPHRLWLFLESRNYVLRGVRREAASEVEIDAWRVERAAMAVTDPPDELCAAASRRGVLIVARVSGNLREGVRRLARWPAVGIVVIDGATSVAPADAAQLRTLAPGKLLAARLPRDVALSPPAWARLALVDADALLQCGRRADSFPLPVIACRDLPGTTTLPQARAACDALQRDVAALGLFAGYVV
ncbi:MAG: hypothetical protein HYS13_00930 [Planctomycetia bacterium]|nr:hypothetical protein [Planctomycetia bacterium]